MDNVQPDSLKDTPEATPEWLVAVLAFMKPEHAKENLKVGVYGLAKKCLWGVEADGIPEPRMTVGKWGNLVLVWNLPNEEFILDFRSYDEFRYRHFSRKVDTGILKITRNHIDRIRDIFDDVFLIHQTRKATMLVEASGKGKLKI